MQMAANDSSQQIPSSRVFVREQDTNWYSVNRWDVRWASLGVGSAYNKASAYTEKYEDTNIYPWSIGMVQVGRYAANCVTLI
jgi:hypothetical protein